MLGKKWRLCLAEISIRAARIILAQPDYFFWRLVKFLTATAVSPKMSHG